MKALDAQSLRENTFVFFTSDNGPEGDGVKSPGRGSQGGLRGRKRDLHEGGIRVPGLARWPGHIPAGSVSDTTVIGSDLFPTFLAAAGLKAPADRLIDGIDVTAALSGQATGLERPQPLYWRLHMAPNAQYAMRVGDWKLLADATLTQYELYNLRSDPAESKELSKEETARFTEMRERFLAHNAAVEAEGPDWWKRLNASGGKATEAGGAKGKGKDKAKRNKVR
jgi:arylsulfatase A-like enzyme